jgi:multidrug efflux system membrane fusion protein
MRYINNQLVISNFGNFMMSPLSCFVRLPFAIVCCVVLASCSKTPPQQEPIRAVKILKVGESSASYDLEFSGEIRARVESTLGFRVGGKLINRQAELGQRVKVGQLLAQIDPQDYRVAADAAAAQLIAAQSNRDVAVADLKRYQGLFDQGFISVAELERRQASEKAAQAQWRQAQAQNTVQGNQSNYTHLLADGAGVITSIDASAGQVVAAGQPVVRLALDGPRDVVFSVSEDKLASLKAGVVVDVRQWQDGKTLEAKVRDVSASADLVTRTFVVKAALPKEADPVLGSTATVSLRAAKLAGAKARIKLPTQALRTEAGATAVWVLDPATMTVKSQPIQVLTTDGNDAVVDSGLQDGDQVVISGVHVLTAGQKVSVFGAGK